MKQVFPILLATVALAAQDNTFTLRRTSLKVDEYTYPATASSAKQTFATDDYHGWSLRYGRRVASFGEAQVAFEGSWQLKTDGTEPKLNGKPLNNSGTTIYEMNTESFGLGASLAWTKVVDFGGSLELRYEATELKVTTPQATFAFGDGLVRPWITLRVGYTFQLGAVKPSFGVEYGLPLAKHEGGDTFLGGSDIGMKLQPKNELAFTAGLRF
jgi:hypothetical protein